MASNRWAVAALALAGALPAAGGEPAAGIHALVGARIVVAPGRSLPSGTVVVRDGVIAAVGSNLAVPAGARVWELAGKTLYPGLIDAWVPRAWPEEKADAAPQGAHPNPLVRPERDAVDRLRDEAQWKALRAAGFTTALVVPEGGVLRGRGAIANLGDDPSASLLARDAVQAVRLEVPRGQGDRYPESLMGVVALFRQALLDARWHRQAHAAYRANPAQSRPRFDASLAALEPAAHGEATVVFECDDVLGAVRARALAAELGLEAWLVGSGAEYQRLGELATKPLPLVLPVAFPERPAVGDEGDDLGVRLEDLRHWDEAPANPARLAAANLTFALTSFRQKRPADLWQHLARAVERGLSPDAALTALTKTPAELLGLSGRAGSIEPGKMANLVVVDGELLVAKPKIEAVWIDGRHYANDLDEKPPTKGRKGAEPEAREAAR
ncbi:MAG: amidohydrolase family protein [Thermoanaerobaculia bacterium]|nr:amidohydrolase family protein [Thermoanaerobaculia bacterium]